MARTTQHMEEALAEATRALFRADRNSLSVNAVRQRVEDELGLDAGYFKTEPWKARSKSLITATVDELFAAEDGNEEAAAQPDEEAALKPDEPAAETVRSQDDDVSEASKGGRRRETKKARVEAKEKPPAAKKRASSGPADGHASDSGSSLSSVLDEAPPRKRAATKKGGGGGERKRPAAGAGAASAASAAATPDEAEIKKLQGQLVKCGVRKIWAFELRPCGDDAQAKIRHLRGLLRGVGMTGRFSEARAREIKERRELEADLEAVQEMDRNWGVSSSRRAAAAAAAAAQSKSRKEDSSDDEAAAAGAAEADHKNGSNDRRKTKDKGGGNGDDDDDEDGGGSPKTWAKGRSRRRDDLAFLGSETDSE